MRNLLEILKAVLYGITEGITEWLPISSTGHLILLEELFPFRFSSDETFMAEYWEMFEVVIQLGAVLAVVVLFWNKIWPFSRKNGKEANRAVWTMWFKVVAAGIPAGIVGVFIDPLIEKYSGKSIDGWLYNVPVVVVALIVYGIAFIVVERINRDKMPVTATVADITYRQAFLIGLFQLLAFVPGTSRSGSTILGGILLGLSRTAAAEFTFFLAVPIMGGASGLKMLGFFMYTAESGVTVPAVAWMMLLVGCAVSFLVSIAAIRFLMDFVRRHSFSAFGVYRIVLGAVVLLGQFVR